MFVDAFTAKDKARLESLMTENVKLDGPFPLGKKAGPAKTASALLNVGKLGVKIEQPETVGDSVQARVKSPAGAMVIAFQTDGDLVSQIDVTSG